jgi:hypothetical protein
MIKQGKEPRVRFFATDYEMGDNGVITLLNPLDLDKNAVFAVLKKSQRYTSHYNHVGATLVQHLSTDLSYASSGAVAAAGYKSTFNADAEWEMTNDCNGTYEITAYAGGEFEVDMILYGTKYPQKIKFSGDSLNNKKIVVSVGKPKPYIPGDINPHIKIKPLE